MVQTLKYKLFFALALAFAAQTTSAATYYVATTGSDANPGTFAAPFGSLKKGINTAKAGDTVWIRGGEYRIAQADVMVASVHENTDYAHVFEFSKSGTAGSPICYFGYPGERPVFNLTDVKIPNVRHTGFWVNASYLHFRNFEIVGTQVTISIQGTNTQSENIRQVGGSSCIYENLAMHDSKAVGFYLTQGSNTLVLNCDAYDNFDNYGYGDGGSSQKGGNVDGFGMHPNKTSSTGNVFRGCRAWRNSDDGYDLISSAAPVTIESCWSYRNGYDKNDTRLANGAGFKAGGYGMSKDNVKGVYTGVSHVVRYCLAADNPGQGFYANHHTGYLIFYSNTAYGNASGFNMQCRSDAVTLPPVDVNGYGHNIRNNISVKTAAGKPSTYISNVNEALCTIENNSWQRYPTLSASDFVSTDMNEMLLPRKPDGSLPDIGFMRPKPSSSIMKADTLIGYTAGDTSFAITYVLNGGTNNTGNPNSYSVHSGTIRLLPAVPSDDGLIFDRWDEGDSIAAGSYGDKTFTALWLNGYYKVYLMSNDTIYDSISVRRGERMPTPDTPPDDGHHVFRRWQEASSDTVFNIAAPVFSNITLKAQWRAGHRVTFTGDSIRIAPAFVRLNDTVIRPSDPQRSDGYTFAGWLLKDTLYDFSTVVTQHLTLTAQWKVEQPSTAVGTSPIEPLLLYPNPTTGRLTIANSQPSAYTNVEVLSISGAPVASLPLPPGSTSATIDISHLPTGTYIVKVGNKLAKVIKQ